jgi:hypothetical protein
MAWKFLEVIDVPCESKYFPQDPSGIKAFHPEKTVDGNALRMYSSM